MRIDLRSIACLALPTALLLAPAAAALPIHLTEVPTGSWSRAKPDTGDDEATARFDLLAASDDAARDLAAVLVDLSLTGRSDVLQELDPGESPGRAHDDEVLLWPMLGAS